MRKKLKNQKGFSTVELLLSCILLIAFTGILALGTGLVSNTLRDSMSYSESQTLNGILTNLISDQIRFQGRLSIYADEGNGNRIYVRYKGDGESDDSLPLLSSSAYPKNVCVQELNIVGSDGFSLQSPSDEPAYSKPTRGTVYTVTLTLKDDRGELSSSTFEVKCHYESGT